MSESTELGSLPRIPRLVGTGRFMGVRASQWIGVLSSLTVSLILGPAIGGWGWLWALIVLSAGGSFFLARVHAVPLPTLLWYRIRGAIAKLSGQSSYRYEHLLTRRRSELRLPGRAGRVMLFQAGLDAPIPGVAVVYDPHARPTHIHQGAKGTLTLTASVATPSVEMMTDEEEFFFSARMSRGLGATGRLPEQPTLVLRDRTVPAPPIANLHAWEAAAERRGVDASSVVAQNYADVVDRVSGQSVRHEATLSIVIPITSKTAKTIRKAGGGRHGDVSVASEVALRAGRQLEIAGYEQVRWQTPRQLARDVRVAFVPDDAVDLSRREGEFAGADPDTAGPIWLNTHSDYIECDGWLHRTLWAAEWPQTPIGPGVLRNLVTAYDVLRTITLIAKPMPVATEIRDIRAQQNTLRESAETSKRLRRPVDFKLTQKLEDLDQRMADIQAGQTPYAFTCLVTISARSMAELDHATSMFKAQAATEMIELRELGGAVQQMRAFVATNLPVGEGL